MPAFTASNVRARRLGVSRMQDRPSVHFTPAMDAELDILLSTAVAQYTGRMPVVPEIPDDIAPEDLARLPFCPDGPGMGAIARFALRMGCAAEFLRACERYVVHTLADLILMEGALDRLLLAPPVGAQPINLRELLATESASRPSPTDDGVAILDARLVDRLYPALVDVDAECRRNNLHFSYALSFDSPPAPSFDGLWLTARLSVRYWSPQ